MQKVYIWGAGKNGRKIYHMLNLAEVLFMGFVDNNPQMQGKKYEGCSIVSRQEIDLDYDYMILSLTDPTSVLYQMRLEGMDTDKCVSFFAEENIDRKDYAGLLDRDKWKIAVLEEKLRRLEVNTGLKIRNCAYEIAQEVMSGKYRYPKIADRACTIDKIVNEKYSFIRFGDGEFEIIAGKERAPFQTCTADLSRRLRQALQNKEEKILVGLADHYASLERYTEDTANGIRDYLTEETRTFHYSLMDFDKEYHDAYIFKPYLPYRDKENTRQRVNAVQRIWDQKDVVMIEGKETRTGQGNDLLDNAASVERVLCPTKNSYRKYEKIFELCRTLPEDKLVLITLGPAGKVLAYDLYLEGYQVVDIGQIDMDYEWFLAGAGKRVPIPHKYVSQISPMEIEEIHDEKYERQIRYIID